MTQYLYALSETLSSLPWALLSLAACWDYLRWSKKRTLVALGLLVVWLALGGLACAARGWPTTAFVLVTLLACLALMLFSLSGYTRTKTLWLVASVSYLGAYATFIAVIVDAYAVGDTMSDLYLAWPGALTQWGMSVFLTALLWRPVRRTLPSYLRGASYEDFWNVAWLLPAFSTALLVIYVPEETSVILAGRVGYLAAVNATAQLVLVGVAYWLVTELSTLTRARLQEAEERRQLTLAVAQQAHRKDQYEEARRARHDVRHHLRAVSALLSAGDYRQAIAYLDQVTGDEEVAPRLSWCQNQVVDLVASYNLERAQARGADIDARLALPEELGLAQTDLAVVVGNVLENAANAVERDAEAGRDGLYITVRAELVNGAMVVFTCKNSCMAEPVRDEVGGFVSTRIGGEGLGLGSVRTVAERTGGFAQFDYANGAFTSYVVLGLESGAEPAGHGRPLA